MFWALLRLNYRLAKILTFLKSKKAIQVTLIKCIIIINKKLYK